MDLNFAHLHLLLNHFPIVGMVIGFALFLVSFWGKNQDLRRSGLMIFAGVALLTIPTFLSGFGARLALQAMPDFSDPVVLRHEGSALLSLWFMLATGGFALVELWRMREQTQKGRKTNQLVIFILSTLALVLMARTSNTGGDIRHPEISASISGKVVEGQVGSVFSALEPTPQKFSDLMTRSDWFWGFLMGLHFMGLALIVGTVGVLDLRIMGLLKQFTVAPLQRFIPWALLGLGVNIITGLLAFIGQSESYIYSEVFWLKMLALVLLGFNGAIFYLSGVSKRIEDLGPGQDAPMIAKVIAGTSLLLCFALIFFGRYIQPLGDTIRHASN